MPETVQLSSTVIVRAVARVIAFILLPEPCARILYHSCGDAPYRAETAVEAIESAGFDRRRREATSRRTARRHSAATASTDSCSCFVLLRRLACLHARRPSARP